MTAGHVAAGAGSERSLRALLRGGWDFEAKEEDGGSAGHEAARSGKEKCLRALLEAGWDCRDRDDDGWMAGHTAAFAGKPGCLRILMEAGWDPREKVSTGQRAEDLAGEGLGLESEECRELLRRASRALDEKERMAEASKSPAAEGKRKNRL